MNSSFLFALIFLSFTCCHSSSSMEWNSGLTGWFASPNNTIVPYFGTEFVLAGPPPYDCKPEKCELTFPQCPLLSSTDYSYNELISAFYRKASVDALTLSRNTRGKLSVLLTQSLKTLKSLTHTLIEYLLATLAWAWVNCLMLSVSLVWFILTSYTLNALIIAWCLVCTIFIYKAMVWTFSKLPIFAITWPMKMCWRVLKFRRPSQTKTVDEKAVEGYRSFTVNMKPPKSAVLQLIYEKGDHAGYANCIRLYNGENALITAYHNGVDLTVVGKTGNKIPLSQFKELFAHPPTDIRILVGPPNWEGCLGCKGAHFTTGDRVGKCPASFFTLYDGDWQSNSAQIVGSFDKYATVLSNTDFGDSGTGYYNGKTLLGIHKGHPATGENFNLMAVIPPIPGLTTPRFVYETTMPQGRIFSDEMVKMLHDLKNFKPIGGGLSWAEQVDLGDEKKPRESGNRRRQQRLPKQTPLKHPRRRANWFKKIKSCCSEDPYHDHGYGDPTMPGCYCDYPGRDCPWRFGGAGHRTFVCESQSQHLGSRGGGEASLASAEEASSKETRRAWRENQAEQYTAYFQSIYDWEVSTSPCEVPGFRHCGKIPTYYYPSPKRETEWGRKLCGAHPELGEKTAGFGWPQKGPKAELRSLRLQAERWLERKQSSIQPSADQRASVVDRLVREYAKCETNGPQACDGSVLSWNGFQNDFKEAVQSLQLNAGVGVPYIAYGLPFHNDWVADPQLLPVLAQLTFNRLQKMLEVSFEDMTAEELVQNGLCDPIRLFVKGEPHKLSKLVEGRYRLIMSVSIVDQLVARVLFQNQNKREIALWRAIPSKPGFGLSTDEQTMDFMDSLSAVVGASPETLCNHWQDLVLPTDCSGFDWSVAQWMLEDDMAVRNRLTINLSELTVRLRNAWLKCIGNSVLCLSDGILLAQSLPGIQKSGSYNTSSTNSRIRVMAAYHVGADWAMAMGDDCLESPNSNLDEYKDLGFKVEASEKLEFCSHIFETPTRATPVNVGKMLYRLIHGYNPECGNLEVVDNYLHAVISVLNELRHDPALVAELSSWLIPTV
ncbi:RNA dependent RNA polymerase RdRp P1-P2 [Pterostylis polerovirus]|nr:RNA dependent RNA polymerase RdRp P1-P2 [Pterostylis polerovirus]